MPSAAWNAVLVFGPYHRKVSTTQTPEVMRDILTSGEMWGRVSRHGIEPSVEARNGALPDGRAGFEFFSFVPPDEKHGGALHWRVRADGSVWLDGGWAKMSILIRTVRQAVST